MAYPAPNRTPRSGPPIFPPAWLWLVDEAIPTWVKKAYSPKETWKDKPFSKEDAQFFFKGIGELSELFTEDRPKQMPAYFAHPRYRSGYLLYFLPLQAAKFLALFAMHEPALKAMLEHGRKQGVLRVSDLGAGPGTASIALLLWLLGSREADPIPPVELFWADTNRNILEDGEKLVEMLAASFPKLRGKVKVTSRVGNWWQALPPAGTETSLVLMGHVLNESPGPGGEAPALARILERARGGGVLMIEPAARRPAQIISQLRDELFEKGVLKPEATSLWGPCLHAGRCPLSEGRDWCHFSLPADVPGKWFGQFSKAMGSERHWLKFSFLWIASPDHPSEAPPRNLRRVISDPLGRAPGSEVLVCEPEQVDRYIPGRSERVGRGDLVRLLAPGAPSAERGPALPSPRTGPGPSPSKRPRVRKPGGSDR